MAGARLRLAVLTNSISRINGGIFDAARNLTLAVDQGNRYVPVVLGMRDRYTEKDQPLWGPVAARSFPVRGARIFGYAPGLATALEANQVDILHVHGIWMYPSVVASRWSRGKRAYVVSPHGLLKPWALDRSRWKKRLATLLYENTHLRGAACLHALNLAEAEAFREFGLRNPVCVIPNGAELGPDTVPRPRQQERAILYLGRLHPSKGLRKLIQAWSLVHQQAEASGWRLELAGWDQNGHRAELERLVARLRLSSRVRFLGPQFDAAKVACFQAASAFVLPSETEGAPVTVLEAWSSGLPVLMTHQCNLPEGAAAGAAILMQPEVDSMAAALQVLFCLSDRERELMGSKGRALVEKSFQWQRIGLVMTEVYDWVLGFAPRPACIVN
jgi:glycosyltransferase involved in cell wall biosynthesis